MTTPATFEFDEIFARVGVLGHAFSDRIAALDGQRVRMRGYLTPTEAEGIFGLTRAPVAPCSEHGGQDWPDETVFLLTEGAPRFPAGQAVEVEGLLEHGSLRLEEAGVTSFARLRDARWDMG